MPDLSPMQMGPATSGKPESPGGPSGESSSDARADPPRRGFFSNLSRTEMWTYFGPAFVASVAYIDPGNFATNILGGTQFGYRLLWVLLWSNIMAMLIQYLAAKLGIVTGLTLPQNCRKHFTRPTTLGLWMAAEIAAVATDLAEFLGAAIGLDLLFGPLLAAHGFSPKETLLAAALVSTVLVFAILALDLACFRWLERAIMGFVAIIGVSYAFEIFLVHPDWKLATIFTLLPTLDHSSAQNFHDSIYAAVAMLGATVMPHVVYLHSALVQPRLKELTGSALPASETLENLEARNQPTQLTRRAILSRFLRYELIDVFVAMNGAWLINSAMILMAAVAFVHTSNLQPTIEQAYHTLGTALRTPRRHCLRCRSAMLRPVVVHRRRHGRPGDYRGLPRHKIPHLPAPRYHCHPGHCHHCHWPRPAAYPRALAGRSQLCTALRAHPAASAHQPRGCNAQLCQRAPHAPCRLARRRRHPHTERDSSWPTRLPQHRALPNAQINSTAG